MSKYVCALTLASRYNAPILTSVTHLLHQRHVAASCQRSTHLAQSSHESAATGIRASLGGVFISIVLGAVKIVAGIVGNSYALIADGVESVLDVVSGLVVAGSLKIAVQPPDERYPFGYGKIEPAGRARDCRGAIGNGRRASRSRACAKFDYAAPCAGGVYAGRARASGRCVKNCCLGIYCARANRSPATRCGPTPGTIAAIR